MKLLNKAIGLLVGILGGVDLALNQFFDALDSSRGPGQISAATRAAVSAHPRYVTVPTVAAA